MHAAAVFYPGGVRLSTWLMLIWFLALAAYRSDGKPFLAALAWLWGFEAVYQITCIITGNGSPASRDSQIMLITFGVVSVAVAAHYGVLPSWPIMAGVAVVWVGWVAAGLPASLPSHFNTEAELWNEAAKLGWAFAYMVPLLKRENAAPPRRAGRHSPAGRTGAEPGI